MSVSIILTPHLGLCSLATLILYRTPSDQRSSKCLTSLTYKTTPTSLPMQDFVPHSARSPEEPASPPRPTVPSDSLIKLERHSPSDPWCPSLSSPSSHPIPSFTHIPSFSSGRTPTPARNKRSTYPYTHPPPRVSSGRRQHSSTMSAPHYGNWPSSTVKYEQSEYPSGDLAHIQRRTSDGDQAPYYFTSVSNSARIRGSVMVVGC